MITEQQHVAAASSRRTALQALRTIVTAGLSAGALDITYACTMWALRGATPIRVGQSVAAGLLGNEAAIAGGIPTGILGLALHFVMAIIMAGAYYAAATVIPALAKRPFIFGPAYGLALYGVMNYIVIPLSAITRSGRTPPLSILVSGILVHMFLVGLVIALFTRKALRSR